MKTTTTFVRGSSFFKTRDVISFAFLLMIFLFGSFNAKAASTIYKVQSDTLIVYSDIKGLSTSEFYTIKVRSAATGNLWVECFANITRSLWSTAGTGTGKRANYFPEVADWSHTYANIEMNSRIEVEITKKSGPISYANVHPVHRATAARIIDGKAYFFIDKPAQITIDIDGQMDDQDTVGYTGPAIHTVSIFANPVIDKPIIGAPGVFTVAPGTAPPTNPALYTTLYFLPGLHNVGRNFKIHPNKNYYIPGDAVFYGTMNNQYGSDASNIRIYGYGTISGDKLIHPAYDGHGSALTEEIENEYKGIYVTKGSNFKVEGISIMNSSFHSANITAIKSTKDETFCKWVKVTTWRGNGDGIGSIDVLEDSFIRTQDDCTYVKGQKKRCVFWNDVNGSSFMFAGMPSDKSILVEDCDVIYARRMLGATGDGGRVFSKRGGQAASPGTTQVNVLFNNIRITDKYQTCETFNLLSKDDKGSSGGYSGITFKNITSVAKPSGNGINKIVGWSGGPWKDIIFDNVVIAGKLVANATDFGTIGTNVTNVTFKTSSNIPVTGVSIAGCSTAAINVNATNQLTASVLPANATNKSVNWSSSNTAVATVSSAGLVTAKSAGSATITVTTVEGAKTAICNLTVATSNVAVTGVSVAGCPTSAMTINATNQLTASVLPANATDKSINWICSNTAVATVSSTGLITAISAGSATITAITVEGNKTAVCNVTVAPSTIAVTGVTVTGCPTAAMTVNATNQLTVTVAPTDATNKSVNWSSSNTAVATVSSTGLVTAKTTGSATITAITVDGNKTSVCNLTVASTSCVDQLDKTYVNRTINNQTITNEFFGAVNTSCSSMVTITADVVGQGGLDASDYCKMTYKIDGGTQKVLFDIKNINGSFSKKVFSITVAATSKVELVLNAKNTATDEKYIISNIKIVRASQTTARIGVKEVENTNATADGIRIYPNPVTDILNIDFVEAQGTKEIKIFNEIGQLIYSTKTTNGSVTIDVKTLNLNGVVLVQVVVGSSIYNNKIIIK